MSALLLQRRQHLDNHHSYHIPPPPPQQQQHHYSTTSSPSSLHNNNSLPLRIPHPSTSQYLSPLTSEADLARLSPSPLSTSESSPATSTLDFDSRSDYYMQRSSQDFSESSQQDSRHPSLESVGIQQAFWGQQQQQQTPRSSIVTRRIRHSIPPGTLHKRTNSDSTIHSAPYTPTSISQQSYQPYIVDSELQYSPHHEFFDHHNHSVTSFPKSYPQVSQALDHSQQTYAAHHQTGYNNNEAQSQLHWNEAMREALLQQQQQFQQQNLSYHTMAAQGELNAPLQDKIQQFSMPGVPGLGPRTISAICEDELYNVVEPTIPAPLSITTAPRIQTDARAPSPANSVFSQRLQAANQNHLEAARSASPTTSTFSSRDKSPFRPRSVVSGSPYDPPSSPRPLMNTAAQMREAQRAEAAANALANATRRASQESSQTVSPKEVSLEYDGSENDSQQALFGSLARPSQQHQKRPSGLKQEYTQTSNYDNLLAQEESSAVSNDSLMSRNGQSIQVPQQYPFIRAQRPSHSGIPDSSQESNPRFPSTLISMESTRSDPSEHSSPGNSPVVDDAASDEDEEDQEDTQEPEVSRPDNTRSDGGTYTCTYHGCTQRFETPQKLQKHKKEGHRQGTPSTNADTRLTQAGPHKCERLNPQTGKPCNSVFSRPYDLTRHEDTIHNARKQKVKCVICTEEKTFSRNDALTRHMRVVHPDVDFPGKTRGVSR